MLEVVKLVVNELERIELLVPVVVYNVEDEVDLVEVVDAVEVDAVEEVDILEEADTVEEEDGVRKLVVLLNVVEADAVAL